MKLSSMICASCVAMTAIAFAADGAFADSKFQIEVKGQKQGATASDSTVKPTTGTGPVSGTPTTPTKLDSLDYGTFKAGDTTASKTVTSPNTSTGGAAMPLSGAVVGHQARHAADTRNGASASGTSTVPPATGSAPISDNESPMPQDRRTVPAPNSATSLRTDDRGPFTSTAPAGTPPSANGTH